MRELTFAPHIDTPSAHVQWRPALFGCLVKEKVSDGSGDRAVFMRRCEIPHFGTFRQFLFVSLRTLPQRQRFCPFGKSVFIHCTDHLALGRRKAHAIPACRFAA
ncbi:hypothetical protein [Rhodobacter sp. TJ_12]|uniref:hypothetical protein n=1 Tax=Rhodobacter sp. TJ_12 TaxID=2029399 RepID=UPI001CBBCDF8|nr:hypothetical protein [Rhodobacter sp. TJ_12]